MLAVYRLKYDVSQVYITEAESSHWPVLLQNGLLFMASHELMLLSNPNKALCHDNEMIISWIWDKKMIKALLKHKCDET